MADSPTPHVQFEVGLRNGVASFIAGAYCPPLEEGVVLDFKAEYLGQFLGLTGFHAPEPAGRWTSGDYAAFRVPLRAGAAWGSVLRVKLTPLVTPTVGQIVRVRLNGGYEQVLTFPAGPMTATAIELTLEAEVDLLQVEIFLSPTSPRALGISEDERHLGLMFHSLELVAPPNPPSGIPTPPTPAQVTPTLERVSNPASPVQEIVPRAVRHDSGQWLRSKLKPIAAHVRDFLTAGIRTRIDAIADAHQQIIDAQQQIQDSQQRAFEAQQKVYQSDTARILAWLDRLDRGMEVIEARGLIAYDSAARSTSAFLERLGAIHVTQSQTAQAVHELGHAFDSKAREFTRLLGALHEKVDASQVTGSEFTRLLGALHEKVDASQVTGSEFIRLLGTLHEKVDASQVTGSEFTRLLGALHEKVDASQVTGSEFTRLLGALHEKVDASQVTGSEFTRLLGALHEKVDASQVTGSEFTRLLVTLHEKLDAVLFRSSMLRLDDGSVLLRSRSGYLLVPASDLHLIAAIGDSGLLEPGLNRLLVRLLGSGMVFVDVGANVGLHTLAVGRAGATVHAFEPTPSTFRLLTRSIDLNNLSTRVIAHDIALGAEDMEVDLNVSRICGHNSIYPLDSAEAVIRVPMRRLDDVLPAGQRVDLTKIDAEGAELDILKGMSRVIAENPDQVIVAEFGPSHLRRLGTTTQNWLAAFLSLGFEGFAILEPEDVTVSVDTLCLEDFESVNIVFVRRGSPMFAKLSAS